MDTDWGFQPFPQAKTFDFVQQAPDYITIPALSNKEIVIVWMQQEWEHAISKT